MNGISKESYLKAPPELKDEMMFDIMLGIHRKVDNITTKCPVQKESCRNEFASTKTVGRLWAFALGLPAIIGLILVALKVWG